MDDGVDPAHRVSPAAGIAVVLALPNGDFVRVVGRLADQSDDAVAEQPQHRGERRTDHPAHPADRNRQRTAVVPLEQVQVVSGDAVAVGEHPLDRPPGGPAAEDAAGGAERDAVGDVVGQRARVAA